MKYYLKELIDKYDLLLKYKDKMIEYSYSNSELKYLDGIIYNHKTILDDYLNYTLQSTLRNHSNYRLKTLIYGKENIVDLLFYPEEYVLNSMKDNECEAFHSDTVVFKATDNKVYVFSPASRVQSGLVYKGEKWQKFK